MESKKINPTITIIIIVVVIFALVRINKYFFPIKFDKMGNREITETEIKAAFQKIALQYGTAYARKVEQLFRRESGHFKSSQFKQTLSAGMEVSPRTNTVFPYGWKSLNEYATKHAILKTNFYTKTVRENGTGIGKTFIGFPTIDHAVGFLAWFIKNKRNGEFGKWYTLDSAKALSYESSLNQIIPRYV